MLTFGLSEVWTRLESTCSLSIAEVRNNLFTVRRCRKDECLTFTTCLCCACLSGDTGTGRLRFGWEEAPLSFMFVPRRAENSPVWSWQFRRCEWPLGTVAVHPSSSLGKSRKVGGKT